MPSPQGMNGSIHAPRMTNGVTKATTTNNGIASSMHNPANTSKFTFSAPTSTAVASFASPPSTKPSSPTIPTAVIPFHNPEAEFNATTIQPFGGDTRAASPRRVRRGLNLEPVFLVGAHSSLPHFSIDDILLQHGEGTPFYIETLAAGIAQGCSIEALRCYLNAFLRIEVEQKINGLVKGRHPVLFYAAERNCVSCIRLLLDYGSDPNACDADSIPVLGFAIMRSKSTVLNPTEVVKMLLAFGARPQAIPTDMWQDYIQAPSTTSLNCEGELILASVWCTGHYRKVLSSTLNLSIRYYLHRASHLTIAKGRNLQLAQAHNYTALLKMPYLIIGQDYATKHVVNVVSAHLAMRLKTPLVLVFAGLSGHGKTELAKQMGHLLHLPMTVIDCAQMHSQIALFGSRLGYIGNAHGSQLNNHLADHSAERSVVFLDEFDKTDKDVHNSLLLLLNLGEYHDRRNNKPVDASKTIWIMATNLGDREITNFYRDHLEDAPPIEKTNAPYNSLTERLKSQFRDTFGPPMAGRMKNVAPFFPFDENEQAAVVHKFLMELVEHVRSPIDTSILTKHYPGHVHLAIRNDGKLCAHLARESYIEELGARSLISAIDDVRIAFFTSFTETDELVSDEMNYGTLMKFTAQLQPVSTGDAGGPALSKVVVAKNGYTSYYQGQGSGDEAEDDLDSLNDTMSKMMDDEIVH